jgi:Na+/melibiose symporter-like transporter
VTDAIPPATRGSIGTIFQINICAFILVGEIVNYACHPDASDTNVFIPEWKWRIQLALSALPGLAMVIVSFIMHESPVYLQSLNEKEGLLSAGGMTPVASGSMSDDSELQRPDISSNSVEKQGWGALFSRPNLKYVAIAMILSSSQQLTGINAIIFYAPGIFKDANMANPLVLTIAVVGTWNLLSVFISFVLVDRLGRRTLMLGALAVMTVGSGLMALAYEAFPSQKGPVAILALLLFVGAFECGPGPLFFLMAVESCQCTKLLHERNRCVNHDPHA